MKWFKHETNAHINLKLQSVVNQFGLKGYGYYWGCIELVGLQGNENFSISSDKFWQIYLKKQLNVELEEQKEMLAFFANLNLIDGKSLKKGDLSIPKLAERQDEYTEKLRRKSGQSRDNVPLDKNRTEEIRIEQNRLFEEWWSEYPSSKRNVKKADAKAKFLHGVLTVEEIKRRLDHLKNQKSNDRRWIGENGKQFIPNMSTYLNQERWDMDIEKVVNSNQVIKL